MPTIALHSIIIRTSLYSPNTSHTRCGIWGHSPLCSPDRFRRRMIGDAGWGHNHHSAVWVSLSPGATFRRTATSSIILRSWHHQFLPHRAVEWANNTLIRRLFRWSLRSQTMTSDVTGLCAGDVIDWMSEWSGVGSTVVTADSLAISHKPRFVISSKYFTCSFWIS